MTDSDPRLSEEETQKVIERALALQSEDAGTLGNANTRDRCGIGDPGVDVGTGVGRAASASLVVVLSLITRFSFCSVPQTHTPTGRDVPA